jgi:flavin reductase (DIM6/NTAB) family NADH-FMN oxidoreductase RutF
MTMACRREALLRLVAAFERKKMPFPLRFEQPERTASMSIVRQCRSAIQKFVFGDTLLPQEFFIGLPDPQKEITVSLHGMGMPLDVTCRHSMACAAPFTICIASDGVENLGDKKLENLYLKFCERNGQKRMLGEIGLKLTTIIPVADKQLILFEARSAANYCLPKVRLWAHYLLHSYLNARKTDTSGIKMSFLERRAAMVIFICPRPVVLVSLTDEAGGNIFPMNIMGDLGDGYFVFALKDSRRAAHLVERAGRIAVSSLPLSQAPLAYQLAVNHTKESIAWDQLPFETKASPTFNIPVPVFAQRVREMEIRKIYSIGSHTFFAAQIIRDEIFSKEPELCVVHGFYQAWRVKDQRAELQTSLATDSFSKKGFHEESRQKP